MRPHEGIGEEIEPPLIPGGFDEADEFKGEVAEVVAAHIELFEIGEGRYGREDFADGVRAEGEHVKELKAVDLARDEGEIVGREVEFEPRGEADVGVGSEVVSIGDAVKGAEGGATEFGEMMAAARV